MKHLVFVFCLLATCVILSCKKSETKVSANTVVYDKSKLKGLFSALATKPKNYTVTAGILQTVVGQEGTVLTFYPNSFEDSKGNIISLGTIEISLIEMYKPGAMISNGATTMANSQLLISGGQIYVTAKKDDKMVFANVYGARFHQPAPSTQPMILFFGDNMNEDSLVTWTVYDTTLNGVAVSRTGFGNVDRDYIFDSCTNFNWLNCDYFYIDSSPKTQITITLPDTSFNPGNTKIFLVFPGINSVFSGGFTYFSEYSFVKSMPIPEGLQMTVVAIAKKNDNYYYSEIHGLSVSATLTVNAALNTASLEYIETKLKSL